MGHKLDDPADCSILPWEREYFGFSPLRLVRTLLYFEQQLHVFSSRILRIFTTVFFLVFCWFRSRHFDFPANFRPRKFLPKQTQTTHKTHHDGVECKNKTWQSIKWTVSTKKKRTPANTNHCGHHPSLNNHHPTTNPTAHPNTNKIAPTPTQATEMTPNKTQQSAHDGEKEARRKGKVGWGMHHAKDKRTPTDPPPNTHRTSAHNGKTKKLTLFVCLPNNHTVNFMIVWCAFFKFDLATEVAST